MDKLRERAQQLPREHPQYDMIMTIITKAIADYYYAADEAKVYIIGKAQRQMDKLIGVDI